jgi:hypothetical protein
MPERTFSQEQINSLLRRASELHVTADDEAPGLTLAELEQIAAESGIPPRYLRAALEEADHGVTNRDTFGQTGSHAFVERVIPGDLSGDDWEAVILKLRKKYGSDDPDPFGMGPLHGRGVTERLGSTHEWRHSTAMGVTSNFTIRSSKGKQHVSFQRRVGLGSPRAEGLGYGLLVAILAAMVMGGATESVWILFLTLAVVWAVAAPSIEALDRKWRGKILREMKGTVDDLDGLLREQEEEDSQLTADGLEAGVRETLGLLDLEDTERDKEEPQRRKDRARSR